MAMQMQQENAANNQQDDELRLAEAGEEGAPVCSGAPVMELVAFGIDEKDVQKLMEHGMPTVASVANASARQLETVKGLSAAKAAKIKNEARKIIPLGFQSAVAVAQEIESRLHITTGSKQLDDLLQGGFESGTITEMYGESRSGKTQLCHMLAVAAQLGLAEGGGEGKCLYIDTEGTFRPQRIQQICPRFDLEAQDVLENIAYARAHNVEHQFELLAEATKMMQDSRFSVVIVDSATALYRSEFKGRGELADRQAHMCKFLRGLQRIADNFGCAVVITNQVVATVDGGGGGMFNGPQLKAIGGNIMAHATTTRLWVKRAKANNRAVKVMASPCLPENDAQFGIADQGVVDADAA